MQTDERSSYARDSRDGRDNREYRSNYGGGRDGRDGRDSRGYDDDGRRGGGRGRGTPLSELDPALTDVSRRVIGSSIEVHKALGPGFSQDVYLNALCGELDAQGVRYSRRHAFPVHYKGGKVGDRVVDLFVDNRFIVEVLAAHQPIGSIERAVVRAGLRCADLELGLIINFGEMRLKDGLVRVLNPDKLNAMKGADGQGEYHDDGDSAGDRGGDHGDRGQ
jgi:GxxExxY protein